MVKELLKALLELFRAIFCYEGNSSNILKEEWNKLPTLNEYIAKHPECSADNQQSVRCSSCGSTDIMYQPLTHSRDRREKHFCVSCKRTLYKSYAEF